MTDSTARDISWWMTEGSTVQTEEDTALRILWREPRIPATLYLLKWGCALEWKIIINISSGLGL